MYGFERQSTSYHIGPTQDRPRLARYGQSESFAQIGVREAPRIVTILAHRRLGDCSSQEDGVRETFGI